jgi:dienelactone hydrolase
MNSFRSLLVNAIALMSLIILSSSLFAQPFEIGHTSALFYDSVRDRDVATEIYYPADSPGENEPVSVGEFPVLVFGHGFLMGWESYENFWTEIVPNGYVMCFPTTESGITPDHQEFGQDLKFLAAQMQIETGDNTSIFFNSLAEETAIMGHSMGGGASFLAAENNSDIHALINFAAAETDPSAIAAASNITIASLLFSGEDDCVTPPADHQDIMYESLNSDCKTHVKIINGGHCYFADDNFTCNLGESFCNPTLDITPSEQQSVTNDFLNLWLDYSLKADQNAFEVFTDSLETSARINFSHACNSTSIQKLTATDGFQIFPNPVIDNLNLKLAKENTGGLLRIYGLLGNLVHEETIFKSQSQMNLSNLAKGTYMIFYARKQFSFSGKLIRI